MKVSIIVPVFNAGTFLREAVQSALNNTAEGYELEILLVDDKSTDEVTLSLLDGFEKDPQIRVIRQTENGGPAKARNAGLRVATGDWVGFLDADDIMAPGTMEHRINVIKQIPEARWLLADILEMRRPNELSHENHFATIQNVGKVIAPSLYHLSRPTKEMLEWPMLPVLGAMLVRKDVFAETGLLGEKLTYGEDIHFCLVLSRYADLYWTPKPCLYLRRHHESMTKDTFRGAQAMPKASLLLLKDKQFYPYKKQLRWQHAANLRLLSKAYANNGNKLRAIISAISALRWVPNDMRNIKALQESFFSKME
ncbi:glycosyltransferase family 2 protein [Noviherbaspirillum soli]|uniref:glycosyltransferase family 2 protein n=1 Tax=Noviherbaspirillum soli TaxID=1064518 RepID=UPI00188D002E|nr:glycosyltransferase [Noviherbaspirillum soli]